MAARPLVAAHCCGLSQKFPKASMPWAVHVKTKDSYVSELQRNSPWHSHAVTSKDSEQENEMHLPSTTWDVVIPQQIFLRTLRQTK